MNFRASPNFNQRAEGCSITYVVLHYTGMTSAEAALTRLCDPESEVSAHYFIDEDGTLTQMVDERLRAWHAGASCWYGQDDLNSTSIGIELSNPGHENGYSAFTEKQLARLEKLLALLFSRYKLAPSALLAHSDIAPQRKWDPGEKFPWQRFAALGFGLWPDVKENQEGASEANLKALLEKIGYDCTDEAAALTAFKRHYCPQELETETNEETKARLVALTTLLSIPIS